MSRLAFNADLALVRCNDLAADVKTQAKVEGVAAVQSSAVAIEESLALLWIQTLTIILHCTVQLLPSNFGLKL